MENLRDNKDGTCNCKPLGTGCFFTDGFDGRCDCKCHTPEKQCNHDRELMPSVDFKGKYYCRGCEKRFTLEEFSTPLQKETEAYRCKNMFHLTIPCEDCQKVSTTPKQERKSISEIWKDAPDWDFTPTSKDEEWRDALRIKILRQGNGTSMREILDDIQTLISKSKQEGYDEGKIDGIMEESVKRYDQAKEDGTLDKHFPKI